MGQEATVERPPRERPFVLDVPSGRSYAFWDGDPATEDALRVLAFAGGATVRHGDIEVRAQNVLVWLDAAAERAGDRAASAAGDLPFGVAPPAGPVEAQDGAPFLPAGDLDDPERMALPVRDGQVRAIYAEGDVYLAQGDDKVFQAEQVYLDLVEERSIVVRGEMRTNLAAVSSADLTRLRDDGSSGFGERGEGERQPPVPIVIRAAEIRGVARGLWEARNAQFTTSTFAKPGYHVAMDRLVYEELVDEVGGRATGYGNSFVLGDVPLLHLPYFTVRTGVESPLPLIGLSVGASSRFGAFVETRWGGAFEQLGNDFNRAIGVEGDFTGLWFTDVNLYSARGVGLGGGVEYETKRAGETVYFGSTQFFWIHDLSGDDETGRQKDGFAGSRGRFKSQNRVFLPDGWQFDTELNYVSDRNFLREFMEDEFREEKEPETLAYLKEIEGDAAVTALARFRLNDWQTQTEYLPQVTYHVISRPIAEFEELAEDLGQDEPVRAYWSHRSEAGFVRKRYRDGSGGDDGSAFRVDDVERLSTPFEVGDVGIDPYVENRLTAWLGDGTEDGDSEFREAMSVGFNASTQYWRIDPTVESEFWNVHGLRHIVEPTLRYRWTFLSTASSDDLVPYDAVERFDRLHSLVPGMRNRYQTKRLTRFGPETVTFLDVDVQQALVFDNAREDTDTIGDLFVDATWRPDLDRYLLRDSTLRLRTDVDWAGGALDRLSLEFRTEPGPDFYARAAWSYAQRGRTSPTLALEGFAPSSRKDDLHSVTFEFAYQATRLWEFVLQEQFDIEEGSGAQTSLILRRRTADWIIEFELGAPGAGTGTGFGMTVTPVAFFRRDERDRFQSALDDGFDLTPIFDEPSYSRGPASATPPVEPASDVN